MIDELYRLAIDTLKQHLDAAKTSYSEDDGDLLVLGHRLGLSIGFESFVRQGNQTIAPLDVQIHLDGDRGDRFRVGTLGVGDDRLSAMRSAIEEWHLLAASPVLAALGAEAGARRRHESVQQLSGWDLFAGRAGIRGTLPGGLEPTSPFHRRLVEVLRREVAQWPAPAGFSLRSIFIMVTTADQTADVQAAVDGFVEQPLVDELALQAWPTPAAAYLFKQLFVLRRGH